MDPGLAPALARAGIPAAEPPSGSSAAHVVMTGDANHAGRFRDLDVVVVGREARTLRAPPGRHARRYVVMRASGGPSLLALDTPEVRRFLARTWSRPTTLRGRARNALLAGPVGRLAATVAVVSSPLQTVPYPIAHAVPAEPRNPITGWLFALREGDDLQRVIALVFRGSGDPAAVLKFSRLPGAPARGAHEAVVLDELRRLAPQLSAGATAILRRGELDGSEFTVEAAAPGTVLTAALHRERDICQPVVEDLLRWSRSLGVVTRRDDPAARAAWLAHALTPYAASTAGRLDRVPVVLAHQDLGAWNVVATADRFVVVDWESATTAGLPLSDTAYLLTDLLVQAHGPADDSARAAWARELWAGALPESADLRRRMELAARQLDIADDQLGAIVTATWLHHGLSRQLRSRLLDATSAAGGYLGELAQPWLADHRLGSSWPGFAAWDAAGRAQST